MSENNIMKIEKEHDNTATLLLNNFGVLKIAISKDGDGIYYQYSCDKTETVYEAEVSYEEDVEEILGSDNHLELFPCFKSEVDGNQYFLGQFLRDNYGR